MDGVMLPSTALLNAKTSPLILAEAPVFWDRLGQIFWKHHMASQNRVIPAENQLGERTHSPVLKLAIHVLLRIFNSVGCHFLICVGARRIEFEHTQTFT